jgi:methyltransferase
MSNWQLGLWLAVMGQRLIELLIAHYNSKWIQQQGGYEVGKRHYPLFFLLHTLFFLGIWLEADSPPTWWKMPLFIFLVAQLLRIWSIISLGRFWNTRIWVLPNRLAPVRGPYRYLRHPNYLAVIIEFLTLPLLYQAYVTATLFSVLNVFLLLKIRIPVEERALQEATPYKGIMKRKKRMIPSWKQR